MPNDHYGPSPESSGPVFGIVGASGAIGPRFLQELAVEEASPLICGRDASKLAASALGCPVVVIDCMESENFATALQLLPR